MVSITRKGIRGLLKRTVLFTLLITVFITTSILVYEFGPPDTVYQDGTWGSSHYYPPEAQLVTPAPLEKLVLLDQHSHTIYSDGELTPEQNLQWHIAMGYNACMVSDHHTLVGALQARAIARQSYNDSIKIILGYEYSTNRIHMNFFGVSAAFEAYLTQTPPAHIIYPTDAEIQAIIQEVQDHDGMVVVNHIIWSLPRMPDHPTRDQVYAWGADYIEVINEDDYDTESIAFCQAHSMGMITGTDMHSPGSVNAWTAVNVTTFTEEAIFNELKASQTAILFNATGAPYDFLGGERNPAYLALLPLMYLGDMFERLWDGSLDWAGVAVFLGYVFGVFFIGEGLRSYWIERSNKRNLVAISTASPQ